MLYALNAESGQQKWAFNAGSRIIRSSPAISADSSTVFIGSSGGKLYAVAVGPAEFPVLPHCSDGDQHGWPVFENRAALAASPWAAYFQEVYGEVPSQGFPICTFSLSHLYGPALARAKVPSSHN